MDPRVENGDLNYLRPLVLAGNCEPLHFFVLRDRASVARLDRAGNFHGAPAAIVVLDDRGSGWVEPQDDKGRIEIDTSIATTHLMLKATELGLGTCCLCGLWP